MSELHALTFPLIGEKLIEASAGTGKTYTIASLYIRLLLHHGTTKTAFTKPLMVNQILVVTFTEAATAELKARIRQRINDAKMAFASGHTEDREIQSLMAEIDPESYPDKVRVLESNAQLMDEASIFTIHGFCQRMLKQNAFESGALFNTEIVEGVEDRQRQAVQDFWRTTIYPMPESMYRTVLAHWKTPDELLNDLNECMQKNNPRIISSIQFAPGDVITTRKELIQTLKNDWLQVNASANIGELIGATGFSGRAQYKKDLDANINAVTVWAATADDYSVPGELRLFAENELISKTNKNKPTPQHRIFSAIQDFLAQSDIRQLLYIQALHVVRESLTVAKLTSKLITFDDLLSDLNNALGKADGAILSRRIRELYPVAMIDEFQDTDDIQYNIFRHIYQGHADTGWYMIGDPKQAIYSFRGADIFTYIKAKRDIDDARQYTLQTNWRSSSRMIDSVNQLFQAQNAFIYSADIPFTSASPPDPELCAPDNMPLRIHGQQDDALKLVYFATDDDKVSMTEYEAVMAATTAQQIANLLTLASKNQAMIGTNPVQAQDLAVLVRGARQAQKVKQQLLKRGIQSVYLSDRSSVFDTDEAVQLLHIMYACAWPTDARKIKTALASAIMHRSIDDLYRYNQDESHIDHYASQFEGYHKQWKNQGILAMLRQLFHENDVFSCLLASGEGERRITDLLHLCELLQTISKSLAGEVALINWLEHQITHPSTDRNTDQQVRLESEHALVQIITVHKSKGLQYPIVFLPFICKYFGWSAYLYHDEANENALTYDLTMSKAAKAANKKEALAEEVRLFYVGITRAIHQCYLGIAPATSGNAKGSQVHNSAFGYLLNDGAAISKELLRAKIEQLARFEAIAVVDLPLPYDDIMHTVSETQNLNARHFSGRIETDWWVSSFSSLSKYHKKRDIDASEESSRLDADDAADNHDADNQNHIDQHNKVDIFTFPRGAQHGSFLHELFENIDFTQPIENLKSTIITLREKFLYEDKWNAVLINLVNTTLTTKLQAGTTAVYLDQVKETRKIPELEFYFPVDSLCDVALNQILGQHDELSRMAGELVFGQIQGMLKGFIDLFFEYDGRYFILDYKSNYLGDKIQDYDLLNMQKAMCAHRYDFQYQLYSLATHRYLQSRLGDQYNFEQHFGGVFYLFLRGLNLQDTNQYGVFYCRPSIKLIEAIDTELRPRQAKQDLGTVSC